MATTGKAHAQSALQDILRRQSDEMQQLMNAHHDQLNIFVGNLNDDVASAIKRRGSLDGLRSNQTIEVSPPMKPRAPKNIQPPKGNEFVLTTRISKASGDGHESEIPGMPELPGIPQGLPPAPAMLPKLSDSSEIDAGRRNSNPTHRQGVKDAVLDFWKSHGGGEASFGHRIFPKAEEELQMQMKELKKDVEYDVTNFYKTTGYAQKIARSQYFDIATYSVILANTIWIGIETDGNTADLLIDAPIYVQVFEHIFCAYFFIEIMIRTAAFENKFDGFRDGWYSFDCCLVLMMVVETWLLSIVFGAMGEQPLRNLSVLRAFRIVRIFKSARMLRLMRALPELMIMIKGIVAASRSVFLVLCLLVIIIYLFAIACTQLLRDTSLREQFQDVGTSMWTLLLDGIFPDNAALVRQAATLDPVCGVIMLIFILLTTLTVINLLIGVLCQVVDVVATVENEKIDIRYVKTALINMVDFWEFDEDGNRGLAIEGFMRMVLLPECCSVLRKLDVDSLDLISLASSVLFAADRGMVPFGDIMEFILQLRGTNVAKVRNIEDLRSHTSKKLDSIADALDAHVKMQERLLIEADTSVTEVV